MQFFDFHDEASLLRQVLCSHRHTYNTLVSVFDLDRSVGEQFESHREIYISRQNRSNLNWSPKKVVTSLAKWWETQIISKILCENKSSNNYIINRDES